MKLKLDENLSERGKAQWIAAGHDVFTVTLQSMESVSDAMLIEVCKRDGRGLVTLDLDFANPLNFRPSEYAGIAVLRLPKKASAVDLLQAVATLIQGLRQHRFSGKLWIVEIGRIRVYQEIGEA